MAVIYLIRHGQASFGDENYDRLSPVGERQSHILGRHFQRVTPKLNSLCSGGMKRQDHTAELIRESMGDERPPLHTRPEFSEYDHEALFRAYLPAFFETTAGNGAQTIDDLLADHRQLERALRFVLKAWMENMAHEGHAVETWVDFCRRVSGGIDDILHANGPRARIGIVTSGGAITALLRGVLGLSNKRTLGVTLSIYNASVTQLYCPGEGRLRDALMLGYNNITHLEMMADRDLITFR
ncbi:MAG: histidine phosphatase family protein [Gammaproteobacteria bacterium]